MTEECAECFDNLYKPYYEIRPVLKSGKNLGYLTSQALLEKVIDREEMERLFPNLKELREPPKNLRFPFEKYEYDDEIITELETFKESFHAKRQEELLKKYATIFHGDSIYCFSICQKDFRKVKKRLVSLDNLADGIIFLTDQRTYPVSGYEDGRKALSVPSRSEKVMGYLSQEKVEELLPRVFNMFEMEK